MKDLYYYVTPLATLVNCLTFLSMADNSGYVGPLYNADNPGSALRDWPYRAVELGWPCWSAKAGPNMLGRSCLANIAVLVMLGWPYWVHHSGPTMLSWPCFVECRANHDWQTILGRSFWVHHSGSTTLELSCNVNHAGPTLLGWPYLVNYMLYCSC
jgi:hypothetical protein